VRRQVVADVPLGTLLSGGVDFSLVTAMASRLLHMQRTFAWIPRAISITAGRPAAMALPLGLKGRS
jgi:asparagine synthetase B (glutamine-hydrolysing)